MSQPEPVSAPAPAGPAPFPARADVLVGVVVLALVASALSRAGVIGLHAQSLFGVVCFLGIAAAASTNLPAVSRRVLVGGLLLQVGLALFVLSPPGRVAFGGMAWVADQFLAFAGTGADFVFGKGPKPFAFSVLPTIIFVSSFFTVLYYLGVLQFIVRLMSRVMVVLLGTSGAETLSVSANVFMGQTEAPLVIRPFIARMTRSELLTLMVGGMATISGSLMAVYIDMINKAIPDAREASAAVAGILATSVMAAPASLYVSKLILPETETPETLGEVRTAVENPHANVIDAAAAGASDGLMLALNVAAMLIAFVAGVALINAVLAGIGGPTWSLGNLFAAVFAPVAFLMGVEGRDVRAVADLLGTKLVLNEFVAYTRLRDEYAQQLSLRSVTLTTYALTGFANFSSIGIQIGGIGGMARERRRDLAELSLRALLAGFLVTLINASLAGILLP